MLKTRVADEGEMSPIFGSKEEFEGAGFRNCECDFDATNNEVRMLIVAFQ